MRLDEIQILSDFLIFQKENYPQEVALADPIGKDSEKYWKKFSTETKAINSQHFY